MNGAAHVRKGLVIFQIHGFRMVTAVCNLTTIRPGKPGSGATCSLQIDNRPKRITAILERLAAINIRFITGHEGARWAVIRGLRIAEIVSRPPRSRNGRNRLPRVFIRPPTIASRFRAISRCFFVCLNRVGWLVGWFSWYVHDSRWQGNGIWVKWIVFTFLKLEKYAAQDEKAKVFVHVILREIVILVMEKLTIFLAIRGFPRIVD